MQSSIPEKLIWRHEKPLKSGANGFVRIVLAKSSRWKLLKQNTFRGCGLSQVNTLMCVNLRGSYLGGKSGALFVANSCDT